MNFIIAALLTSVIAALLPALGPLIYFGYEAKQPSDIAYVADVLALLRGGPLMFTLARMQGIVCFPSFHTVLAILVVYAHRGVRWLCRPSRCSMHLCYYLFRQRVAIILWIF
jgi:hypothetical protein